MPHSSSAVLRLSIGIPVDNDARYLPGLIDSIQTATRAWGGGDAAAETIFADAARFVDADMRIHPAAFG